MALELDARASAVDTTDEFEFEIERRWAETIVTVMGTTLAVLFASSVAVVMYFA
jgi:hypothetical protein